MRFASGSLILGVFFPHFMLSLRLIGVSVMVQVTVGIDLNFDSINISLAFLSY